MVVFSNVVLYELNASIIVANVLVMEKEWFVVFDFVVCFSVKCIFS